ncbi:hypothetical protein BaRGS_00017037 [Batillaria attramentaria]|uniref:Uncharacterized protein n=1 Tax=Batillaria attramentaria TaxID=370345 RepID=A0ABD0KXL3_9CAEN
MRRFFGKPVLAQRSRNCSSMSLSHQFKCYTTQEAYVVALHPAEDGRIYVLYAEENKGKRLHFLSVYSSGSELPVVTDITDVENKHMQVRCTSSCLLFRIVSSKPFSKSVTLNLDNPPQRSNRCYLLRKREKSKYLVCEWTHTGKETDLFTTNVEDPVKVCANMREECLP